MQEICQKRKWIPPRYYISGESGFVCYCELKIHLPNARLVLTADGTPLPCMAPKVSYHPIYFTFAYFSPPLGHRLSKRKAKVASAKTMLDIVRKPVVDDV